MHRNFRRIIDQNVRELFCYCMQCPQKLTKIHAVSIKLVTQSQIKQRVTTSCCRDTGFSCFQNRRYRQQRLTGHIGKHHLFCKVAFLVHKYEKCIKRLVIKNVAVYVSLPSTLPMAQDRMCGCGMESCWK